MIDVKSTMWSPLFEYEKSCWHRFLPNTLMSWCTVWHGSNWVRSLSLFLSISISTIMLSVSITIKQLAGLIYLLLSYFSGASVPTVPVRSDCHSCWQLIDAVNFTAERIYRTPAFTLEVSSVVTSDPIYPTQSGPTGLLSGHVRWLLCSSETLERQAGC